MFLDGVLEYRFIYVKVNNMCKVCIYVIIVIWFEVKNEIMVFYCINNYIYIKIRFFVFKEGI